MKDIMSLAKEMNDELIEIRRTIHKFAEVGNKLPQTKAFVLSKLIEYGYEPKEICESGIVAVLKGAKEGRTLMLRADMDALKIREKADVPFAAQNGCMHACGHDMHTAMLLGAAKILKKYESGICGNVKFVFQPNEEGLEGAKAMLKAGVLETPKVDAAMALHIVSQIPSGTILCGKGTVMAGTTFFRVRVKGTGCHGAMPETGVDPINIATHIYLALQGIITNEVSPAIPAALTIGRLSAGETANVIPEDAILEGSLRTTDENARKYIYKRVEEISAQTAQMFRGEATVEEICSAPTLKNDSALVEEMAEYLREIHDSKKVVEFDKGGMGSEDFAIFTHLVPSAYLLIGAGIMQEDEIFGKPMHNECVIFNEDILPLGSAIFAHCAVRWLK